MVKIGITGGIGSGKSTISKIWEGQGAKLINADDLAKDLMINNEAVKQKIIQSFGEESYQSNGDLNRRYLAEEAFNKGRVEELNSIAHPAVFKEADRLSEQAEKEGYKALVYEAAILLEKGRPGRMDKIVLVLADEEKRIERVNKRDKTEKKDVTERIKKQEDFETLKPRADIIIRNNGSLQELKEKALQEYKSLTNI